MPTKRHMPTKYHYNIEEARKKGEIFCWQNGAMEAPELSFRVWDKTEKHWKSTIPKITLTKNMVWEFCGSKYERNNLIIQQFTGCYSQNRENIFEGDYIRIDMDHNYGPGYKDAALFEVIRGPGGFFLHPVVLPTEGYAHITKGKYLSGVKDGEGIWVSSWPAPAPIRSFASSWDNSLFDIAGNIFENPELLDQ
jgi:hypothetical protein